MSPAPISVELPSPGSASRAPAWVCQFGAPTRRTLLGAFLVAALSPKAGRAEGGAGRAEGGAGRAEGGAGRAEEGAGAQPGPILRGEIGQPLAMDAPTLTGLRADSSFPGLSATPGERRTSFFIPREAGFGLYGDYGAGGFTGAVAVAEKTPPSVDLDVVAIFTGADPLSLRINGAPAPLELRCSPGARVRLRLANASPDLVSLVASQAPEVVAIDGQPCEIFTARGALPLAPSARFELMFDLGDRPAEFGVGDKTLLRILAQGERAPARPPIAPLPPNPRLPTQIALEKALRVTAKLTGDAAYLINGVGGAAWRRKPLFQVRRGQPVVLTLINQTPAAQTLRLEGHWARLLHALDDGWDPYWRDTLFVASGATLHAAFVADSPGKWPLASASPQKRAKGLAAWFEIR